MIILDTNVVSALMQRAPDAAVIQWLDRQPVEAIWITAITEFETRYGLALLPDGQRKAALTAAFERLLADDLENRVLVFDSAAATHASRLAARRKAAGRPGDMRDTQIAGIALARRAVLATRNLRHFDDAGVTLVDPWAA